MALAHLRFMNDMLNIIIFQFVIRHVISHACIDPKLAHIESNRIEANTMAFGITVAILSIVNFEFEFRVALACGLFLWPSGFEHIHMIQFIRQQMAKWFS